MKDQSHLIDDLDKANTQRLALNLEIVSIKSKVEVTQILWPRDHHRLLPAPQEPTYVTSLVLTGLCLLSALKQ